MLLYMVTVIGYGVYSYRSNQTAVLKNLDEKLALVASGTRRILSPEFFTKAVKPDAISADDDKKNVLALSDYAQKTGVAAVYALTQTHDGVFFTASSRTKKELKIAARTPYFLPFGKQAEKAALSACSENKTIYTTETTKWGIVRRVLIPESTVNGNSYLLGADMDADGIRKKLDHCFWSSFGFTALFICLAIPFIILFRKTEKERIDEFQNLKEMLTQKTMDRTTRIRRKIEEYINKD